MNDINGIMERAEKRHKQLARLTEKMLLDKSEVILQAGQPHEQTNEEYIHLLNTEQLAKVLNDISLESLFAGQMHDLPKRNGTKEWVEWLKQPHTNE